MAFPLFIPWIFRWLPSAAYRLSEKLLFRQRWLRLQAKPSVPAGFKVYQDFKVHTCSGSVGCQFPKLTWFAYKTMWFQALAVEPKLLQKQLVNSWFQRAVLLKCNTSTLLLSSLETTFTQNYDTWTLPPRFLNKLGPIHCQLHYSEVLGCFQLFTMRLRTLMVSCFKHSSTSRPVMQENSPKWRGNLLHGGQRVASSHAMASSSSFLFSSFTFSSLLFFSSPPFFFSRLLFSNLSSS